MTEPLSRDEQEAAEIISLWATLSQAEQQKVVIAIAEQATPEEARILLDAFEKRGIK